MIKPVRIMSSLTFFLTLFLIVLSCAEKQFDPADPVGSFATAKEPYDKEDYVTAIRKLSEFKSRFPYSQFTPESELLIADSHFKMGQYQEAIVSYETFLKLHPKHPKADFAFFRVGESYWADSPDVVSREQEYTQRAVDQWKILLEKYPTSTYTKDAKTYVDLGNRKLAESVQFVASYYCKMKIWHSCAFRYISLLEKFPQYEDLTQEALKKASDALEKVADAKEKDPESDKNIFHRSMNAAQIREKAANLRKLVKNS